MFGGELKLDLSFSQECFDKADIQALAAAIETNLRALVAHCVNPQHGGVTPADFPLAPLSQSQLDELPVAARQIEDLYPLSPMQSGLLFHSLYEPQAGAYVNQLSVEAKGLDAARLGQAWQATLDAHPILRSGFHWPQGATEPVQVVQRTLELPLTVLDWRGRDDQDAELQLLARSERLQFDPAQPPLLRLALVRLDEQRQQLIYTHHHVLLDGWSNALLLGEVLQRYAGVEVANHQGRFADYIGWLQGQDAVADEAFWREQLLALQNPTLLAQSVAHSTTAPADAYADHRQVFDAPSSAAFAAFARQHSITLNTLVQGAWAVLLQRYSGQQTVAFGATVAGRPVDLPGAEQQLGLFINTLAVISQPQAAESVAQWLGRLQAHNLELREHEFTALSDVQRWAGRAGEPLFDSLLVFENFPIAQALQQGAPDGLSFSLPDNHERTNYPLTLAAVSEGQLSLTWSYLLSHFSPTAVARMSQHLACLLEAMVAAPQARLGDLPLLSAAERQQLLHDWNPAPQPLTEHCVHQLIETQAAMRPEAPALIFADTTFSYADLNQRANRLAHRLRELGLALKCGWVWQWSVRHR